MLLLSEFPGCSRKLNVKYIVLYYTMAHRKRLVPEWLEDSENRESERKPKRSATLPRTVVYVMSPVELLQAAQSVLQEEQLKNLQSIVISEAEENEAGN